MSRPVGQPPTRPVGQPPTRPAGQQSPSTTDALRHEVSGLGSDLGPSKQEKEAVKTFLADVTRDVKTLIAQETELAKAEITAEVGKVGKAAGMMAGAGLGALMVLIFLSTAGFRGLANLMNPGWAALIVAAVWALIAAALFVIGRGALRSISLKPERTLNSIKKIPAALKGR